MGDYSHEFIEAILTDTERTRIRRAHVVNPPDPTHNALKALRERLRLYEQTGNSEYLIDVAKFSMLEWIRVEDAA